MYFLIIFSGLSGYLVYGQGCLRASERTLGSTDPPFENNRFDPLPANDAVLAIVTTYKFFCDCVNITSWEAYVNPGGSRQERAYDITFQVWRPSPTVNDTGCYSLVGQNVFTSVSFFSRSLVRLSPTPPVNTIITAQSGDVIGYYTNSRGGQNQGIQVNVEQNYTQNTIWYHDLGSSSLISMNNECPFPIGTESKRFLRSFTNGAPLLRISSTEVPCESSSLTRPLTMVITSVSLTATPLPSTSPELISFPLLSTQITQDEEENLMTTTFSFKTSTMNNMESPAQAPHVTSGLTIILSCSVAGGVLLLIILLCVIFIMVRFKTKSKIKLKSTPEENYEYVDIPSNKGDCNSQDDYVDVNEVQKVKSSDDSHVRVDSNVAYGITGQPLNSKVAMNVVENTAYSIVSKIEKDEESEPYYY